MLPVPRPVPWRAHRILAGLTRPGALFAAGLLQAYALLGFTFGLVLDGRAGAAAGPLAAEALVLVLFWLGSLWGRWELRRLRRRRRSLEHRRSLAEGRLAELLEESFARWRLTPSERDVAGFAVKGLSIAEIAALRRTRSGTVKRQIASVYRKAGVANRAALVGGLMAVLTSGILLDLPPPGPPDQLAR
jgi:DNA-binding CsgD family transcriptional regulator